MVLAGHDFIYPVKLRNANLCNFESFDFATDHFYQTLAPCVTVGLQVAVYNHNLKGGGRPQILPNIFHFHQIIVDSSLVRVLDGYSSQSESEGLSLGILLLPKDQF